MLFVLNGVHTPFLAILVQLWLHNDEIISDDKSLRILAGALSFSPNKPTLP